MFDRALRGAGGRSVDWPAWRAEARATLVLGAPLILANLAQTALTAADVLLMGRLGPHALAAGALGTNLFFAFLIFGIGLMSGTSPLMAQELGRNRFSVRDIRRTVRQGFWMAIAVTIPIWAVLWFAETLILMLGQEPDLAREAGRYVRSLQWAILPWLLAVVLRMFLAALNRPLWALGIALAAVPANFGLAYVLMFGHLGAPALGLVGAGIATSIVNLGIFAAMALVVVTDRRFRRYRLFGRVWRPDWPRFARLWRIGAPIGLTLLFEVTVFNAAAFAMGLFGAEPLAAHSIALQIAALTFMVPLGLSQAVTVRVGIACGAGDREGVRLAGWTAFVLSALFMSAMAIVMLAVPRTLVGAFLDAGSPENARVVELAIGFLVFAALFQLADGAQAVGAGMLRGLGDTRVPMVYAAFGYWGIGASFGLLLAFPGGLEGAGIWIGLATGLAVVSALMLARWLRRDRLGLLRARAAAPVLAPAPV